MRIEQRIAAHPVIQAALHDSLAQATDARTVEAVLAWARDCTSTEEEVGARHWAHLACGPGCAHCCHIAVEASPVEVTIVHRVACGQPNYLARVAEATSALQGDRFRRVPCPLLLERRCSVYGNRPSMCRGENSTSALACSVPGGTHPYYGDLRILARASATGGLIAFGTRGLDVNPVDLRLALAEIAHYPAEEPLLRWLQGEVLFDRSRVALSRRDREALVQIRRRPQL